MLERFVLSFTNEDAGTGHGHRNVVLN